MILLINYIVGKITLFFANLGVRLNPSFRIEFKNISQRISNANSNIIMLPNNLFVSIIAIEDKRYYCHFGVDFYSILRAIYKNLTTQRLEGASTIDQQLIRNLTNEKNIEIKRKLKEVLLATLVNQNYSKNEILNAYLKTYKFNSQTGILSFCQVEKYDVHNISDIECAQITARLKYPALNKCNYIRYLKRVRMVEIKVNRQAHLN